MDSEQGTAGTELLLDIDLKLTDVLAEAARVERWTFQVAVGFLRLAYAQGHKDALEDRDPKRLYRRHGFPTPLRKRGFR